MTEQLSLVPETPVMELPAPEHQEICSILVFRHKMISMAGPIWNWHNCEFVRQFQTYMPGDKVPKISIDLRTLVVTFTLNNISVPGTDDTTGEHRNVFLISAETGKPFAFHGIREMAACGVRYLKGAIRVGNSLLETKEAMLDFSSMAVHVTAKTGQNLKLPFLIGIVHNLAEAKALVA